MGTGRKGEGELSIPSESVIVLCELKPVAFQEQARRREAARQWREQQINELSSIPNRTPQQEEQLRALKLERDFEKRAEEARQEDEEEGEDESAVTVNHLM